MSLKIAVATGLLALIVGSAFGYWLCHLQWEAETERMNASQAQQETERLKKTLEDNRNLQETVSRLQAKMKKENDNAQKKYNALLARINRGDIRVSVPVRAGGGVSATGCTGTANRETRAELDPETVERILAVGRDGDNAIRDLNQCIDQYQSIAKIKEQ